MTADEPSSRPRYSNTSLPPYSYVPGHAPHPVSDPHGHMHGQSHAAPPELRPVAWEQSEAYRYGVDLFNHGYYWEAHESWESLWHAAGRRGSVALFLKALIKLAAAAVKVREGNSTGAMRHARRSIELLTELKADLRHHEMAEHLLYCGVDLQRVKAIAEDIASEAVTGLATPQPNRLLGHWLRLKI